MIIFYDNIIFYDKKFNIYKINKIYNYYSFNKKNTIINLINIIIFALLKSKIPLYKF